MEFKILNARAMKKRETFCCMAIVPTPKSWENITDDDNSNIFYTCPVRKHETICAKYVHVSSKKKTKNKYAYYEFDIGKYILCLRSRAVLSILIGMLCVA